MLNSFHLYHIKKLTGLKNSFAGLASLKKRSSQIQNNPIISFFMDPLDFSVVIHSQFCLFSWLVPKAFPPFMQLCTKEEGF